MFSSLRRISLLKQSTKCLRKAQRIQKFHTSLAPQKYYKSIFDDMVIPECSLTEYAFGFKDGVESAYGNSIALIDSGKSYTYNELKHSVLKCAESLQNNYNVKKGEVVMIILPNCSEYVVALHGSLLSGAIVSPANPLYTATEIAFQIENSGSTKLFVSTDILETAIAGNKLTGNKIKEIFVIGDGDVQGQIPFESLLANDGSKFNPVNVDQKNVAILPYSSGTTGKPKGVVLSHYNLVANNYQITHPRLKAVNHDSKLIGVLPFYHIYGLQVLMNSTLNLGAQITCIKKFDPVEFLNVMQRDKIDVAHLVPPIIVFLAKHPLVNKYDLSNLHSVFSGAAPLGKEITDVLLNRFPNISLIRQGYGLTETSPAACVDDNKNPCRGSAGVLVPNTEMKITCPEKGEPVKAGEEGEILIRGPQVMVGYLNNKEATDNAFDEEGYFKTGDIGYVEQDGFHLHITDRVKELIKVKGFQVPPAELEAHLLEHPEVQDCCVIGVPDERLGEHPKAFLVLNSPDANIQDILDFTNKHVADYKAITEAEIVDVIPKSAAGKILRRVLRDADKEKRKKSSA